MSRTNRWGLFSAGVRLASVDLDFSTILDGDWIRYEFRTEDFRPDPTQKFIVLTPEFTDSAFARRETQYAAFAEQVFELGEWDVRAGLRYEYDGFSDKSYVSPRVSANYRISPKSRVSLTAGTFYQSPRFLDRAADPENFGLQNEKIDHFSLGIDQYFRNRWHILIEGYYQNLSDLVTDGDNVTGVSTNNGEGTSYGADVVLNRRFDNGWSANAVYSYNVAERDDNDGNGTYDADFNHEHLFSLGSRWEINDRWQSVSDGNTQPVVRVMILSFMKMSSRISADRLDTRGSSSPTTPCAGTRFTR